MPSPGPRATNLASPRTRLIRGYPHHAVTTRNVEGEVEPAAVGLEAAEVEQIWDAVLGMYRSRLHPAIALCLRKGGKVVIDRAIGHASGNDPDDPPETPKVRATPDTLFNVFSASKAMTAMAIHHLNQRNLIHLEDPIAEVWPEFGQNGKEDITFKHVLTHRAGVPSIAREHMNLELLSDPAKMAELMVDAKPSFRPGRRIAYHALTGGFVLGEALKRVTGQNIREYLQEHLCDPLKFKHMNYGVSEKDVAKVALHSRTGPNLGPGLGMLARRALGVDFDEAVRLSNAPSFLTSIVPAGNIIGTANEVGRFMELLLRNGTLDGQEIFEPRTVRRAVAEQTYLEVDVMLTFPVRYAMGFMLGGDLAGMYGPKTPNAFGHLGFTYVMTWADPDRDISVCLMTTGKPLITWRAWSAAHVVYRIATLTEPR